VPGADTPVLGGKDDLYDFQRRARLDAPRVPERRT
jgi:hypothetical protein